MLSHAVDVTDDRGYRMCGSSNHVLWADDILVNNAGVHCEKINESRPSSIFLSMLDVNLTRGLADDQALIPHFTQRAERKIVTYRVH